MSEHSKETVKSRFEITAEEPGIGMNNDGELNVVGFNPAFYVDRRAGRNFSPLHSPIINPHEVVQQLRESAGQGKGRMAYYLANSWLAWNDLPDIMQVTLETEPALADVKLIEGFLLQKCSALESNGAPGMDVLALLSAADHLVVMSVSGRINEPFGKLVRDELESAHPVMKAKIKWLSSFLGLSAKAAEPLRYELIHFAAAAIFEAKRFHARTAVMMVQSFDGGDSGARDYKRFARALGFGGAEPTFTVGPQTIEGVELYLGWTADTPSNEGYYILNRRKTGEGVYD